MADFPDYAQFANRKLMEELYAKYSADPNSVDSSWRHFFEGVDFNKAGAPAASADCRVMKLIHAYRKYGHLMVAQNPIAPPPEFPTELSLERFGFSEVDLNQSVPTYGFCSTAQAPLKDLIGSLQLIYGSRIGFEYMDLDNPEMEKWIQERIEPLLIQSSEEEKRSLLESLEKAELLETFLHTKYVGQKRFSIEGEETLIPLIEEAISRGAELGMEQCVIGMSHRGRLNVLANILQKPYSVIFREFEEHWMPSKEEGSADVNYHKGFSVDVQTRSRKTVHLHLAANSSCLEAVDPIVLGITRAKQVAHRDDEGVKIGTITIHGDASVAGQGVVYESLQFMRLPGYATGGTFHIVVNNQIGFTTSPEEGRSTRYCTDIAKAFNCPVFHVNAEDPESCLFAARLAMELKMKFKCDVFIDLNGYRKHGHNEGDEPSFTQPLEYKVIRAKKTIRELYSQSSGLSISEGHRVKLEEAMKQVKEETSQTSEEKLEGAGGYFKQPPAETLFIPFDSAAKETVLRQVAERYSNIPADFHLHPKLQKLVQGRLAMVGSATTPVDWGMAECLAFGSLVLQNVPVRLTGQDSRRATFSYRHAVWVDQENGSLYFPYSHLGSEQARFDVYNSPLSEFACLGFEYGYTWGSFESLVLWEAQYGDFALGAQTVIDHYIMTAEQKWGRYSSLVVLLPHGYEGGGPEHSSGKIERFLQMAAFNNTQIACPTMPAQYFHLLRRQVLRPIKKPLIIFTPKSFLRLPACNSPFQEFTKGQFEEVLDDPSPPKKARRVLLCSGRLYFDLIEKRKTSEIAILRIEQLYPLHIEKLGKLLACYANCKEFFWVQDEPENMGAWEFLQPNLQALLPKGATLHYVGRPRSPVTATGSKMQHKLELDRFLTEAFS